MRIKLLSILIIASAALVGAVTRAEGGQPKEESIVGTVIAYDQFNNLLRLTFVENRVLLIVRTQTRDADKARFIQVAYAYYGPSKPGEGGFPNELVAGAKRWRFKLIRDRRCDSIVHEFAYSKDEKSGTDTELSIPIWKLIPGADSEEVPFGESLPCYTLKAGHYKTYRK